ncbi:MAG: hypothetical protein H6680_04920 [Desulfobacteraceae bacterium]|nr:hypothetical protein [Desulfobacteraceae bacterium]
MDINEKIINEFEKGFLIEDNFFEYAGNLGIDLGFYDLKKVISDSSCEFSDELNFFLFTPDFETRKRFSLIWIEIQCENKEFDLDSVCRRISKININYKGLTDSILADKKLILFFLEKLDFSKKLNTNVLSTVNLLNDNEKEIVASVLWKNVNNLQGKKEKILTGYLEKSVLPFLFSEKEFNFFINILASFNISDSDFVLYLKKLFIIYHKAYRQALETKDFLKNNNIETLMIQGGRVSFSNPDKISEKKNLIWQIALRLGIHNEIFIEDGFDMIFNIDDTAPVTDAKL